MLKRLIRSRLRAFVVKEEDGLGSLQAKFYVSDSRRCLEFCRYCLGRCQEKRTEPIRLSHNSPPLISIKLPGVFRTKRRAKITQTGSVVLKMSAVKRASVFWTTLYIASVAVLWLSKLLRKACDYIVSSDDLNVSVRFTYVYFL